MPSLKKGSMIILSSPSGAGKTTLVKKISKNKNYLVSISHTTRLPRPNEKDGRDYHFTSKKIFKKLIKKKQFLEHAKVFDNYYGSSKDIVIDKVFRQIIFSTKLINTILYLNTLNYIFTCKFRIKSLNKC